MALEFSGRCWKVGDFIPTDQIVKTHRVLLPLPEIAKYVLEDDNPRFAKEVRPGDVLVAGKHFGQSSGRAIATKGLKATGISCIVAEYFSRTFYRNAFEVGLPILECPGIHAATEEGDMLIVKLEDGTVTNERTGQTLQGRKTDAFLMDMLKAGGLIAMAPSLMEKSSHETRTGPL
jgi:3-isopropylmalate/(R)-2-methylmalate dehydratase small subunit